LIVFFSISEISAFWRLIGVQTSFYWKRLKIWEGYVFNKPRFKFVEHPVNFLSCHEEIAIVLLFLCYFYKGEIDLCLRGVEPNCQSMDMLSLILTPFLETTLDLMIDNI
jgi:hypothetical protein